MRLDDPPPGQEAQVDFGLMGTVADGEGRQRRLWALIVTLSRSRYMYVYPTLGRRWPTYGPDWTWNS